MALTAKQRAKVVFYLGWSGLTLVAGSSQFNSVVNDRLDGAAADLEISRIVKDLLDCLIALDEKLKKAQCRVSTSKVDDIKINPEEIERLRSERSRLVRELADHLDIPITKSSSRNVSIRV